jgi:hypothetical protein
MSTTKKTEVNAKLPELKKKVSELRKQIVDMVEARFPKQEEESNYIGMRKVRASGRKFWVFVSVFVWPVWWSWCLWMDGWTVFWADGSI